LREADFPQNKVYGNFGTAGIKDPFLDNIFFHNFPQARPHIGHHKSDDRKERMIFSNAAYAKQVFSASHPHFR